MEPRRSGFYLWQPIGRRFYIQGCLGQGRFEEGCKAVATRIHSGARLPN
jgi:hypothetical protein